MYKCDWINSKKTCDHTKMLFDIRQETYSKTPSMLTNSIFLKITIYGAQNSPKLKAV